MQTSRVVAFVLWSYIIFTVFAHLDDHQLEFYDEARRSINALEMWRGESHWLVPTYAGESDWFGTKPPLLIWLQALFMQLVGVGTLAVRLPAALATLALTGLLVYWARHAWGSRLIGLLAMMICLASEQYVVTHGARSGDYDALLVLFLTAQVACAHLWVTTGKDKYVWLLGVNVLLAGMTKGVAGGFFLPAIGIWLLLSKAGRKQLLRPQIYLSVGAGIAVVVLYYIARNQVDPGYIAQVNVMEWGGRYFSEGSAHAHGSWYYLDQMTNDQTFKLFVLLAVLGVFQSFPAKRSLAPNVLCATVALVFLLTISQSVMKLYWYKSPALPLIGLLAASCLYHYALTLSRELTRPWIGILVLTTVFVYPVYHTVTLVLSPRTHTVTPYHKIPYRDFMRETEVQPPYTVLAPEYNPTARFEVELARLKEKDVSLRYSRLVHLPKAREATTTLGEFAVGDRVVFCHRETKDFLSDRYSFRLLHQRKSCQLVVVDSIISPSR